MAVDLDPVLADRVLASVADLARGGQADVFAERATRDVRGSSVRRSDERPHVPLARDERGVAVRAVVVEPAPGLVRCSSASGDPDERLLDLARRLRDGSAAPVAPGDAAREAGVALPHPFLALLAATAREAIAQEPRLAAIDVEVERATRDIAVASSRWGHARGSRAWDTASVMARASSSDGSRSARASRSRGAPASSPALDAAAARELVSAACDAAIARLEARPLPAGKPTVIVAGGAAGVLLHEAVGHALEADVLARGASFLAGRVGEPVAAVELTVVDDPTLPGLAGTHARDDEGAPARAAVLIESGVLRGVMTDALRAGFRDDRVTGHGRRATFRDHVLPRMTNTIVHAGPFDPRELVATTGDGLLVTRLERASADPLRGRFQVRITEGWRVEDGRLTHPVAPTLLVGSSDELLRRLEVGADASWDDGAGTCGREGQWVPVAVGNPTLRAPAGTFGVA